MRLKQVRPRKFLLLTVRGTPDERDEWRDLAKPYIFADFVRKAILAALEAKGTPFFEQTDAQRDRVAAARINDSSTPKD